MDRPRDHFFPGSALSDNQNLGVGFRDPLDFLAEVADERAGTNE
jgi:hypothetical protein